MLLEEPVTIEFINASTRKRAIPLEATTSRSYNIKSDGTVSDDLSLFDGIFVVKKSFDSPDAALLTLTQISGITLGDGTGPFNVIFTFTKAAISAIPAGTYQYTFDLSAPAEDPNRIFEGNIQFSAAT